ncbi:uncharacterized protein LOC118200839 [Stegodyphus dumicola]|uniref:uncharacterized protein LOC118200839 n=1 Tax=Stegodyphus dumicola TaxID=202533 RepID=UPI0015A7FF96|nr:uncharacterized protein LOC118200839 [Stegodyphus dumicola]
MTLHKWCSNHAELAEDHTYSFPNEEESTTLGVPWRSRRDCFCFRVKIDKDIVVTKRQMLCTIARLFDPIGLLGPIISKAKIFLQRLWLLKLNWNEPFPKKEADEWKKFSTELKVLSKTEIERFILTAEVDYVELHGFADASEVAYVATIYCKSRSRDGEVKTRLVTSKSRVLPIKRVTISRLELCAAVLLAKLTVRVISALEIPVNKVYLWSDFMIVL